MNKARCHISLLRSERLPDRSDATIAPHDGG